MYRELDPKAIVATAEALTRRIAERFPDSGLWRVSRELSEVALATQSRIEALRRPHWPTRLAVGGGLLVILSVVVIAAFSFRFRTDVPALSELLQGLEAAINDLVFIGLAAYFLLTAETRVKRRRALKGLHELRSVAHIIDLHQLTKDPEQIVSPGRTTPSSPERSLGRFELARYLDYCSELLSITSNLAALYVQYLNDPVVLSTVNDVQTLAQGLSAKVWQKIMILDSVSLRAEPAAR